MEFLIASFRLADRNGRPEGAVQVSEDGRKQLGYEDGGNVVDADFYDRIRATDLGVVRVKDHVHDLVPWWRVHSAVLLGGRQPY